MDAVVDEELLERHDLIEEPRDLDLARELHDPFDAGAVVPGTIEERDLAARRQLLHVTLEVPLPVLGVVRCRERDVTGEARVHVLAHSLDRPSLPRRVAPLEQEQHTLSGRAHP